MSREEEKAIVLRMPVRMHRKFKTKVYGAGMTVKQAAQTLIQSYLDGDVVIYDEDQDDKSKK